MGFWWCLWDGREERAHFGFDFSRSQKSSCRTRSVQRSGWFGCVRVLGGASIAKVRLRGAASWRKRPGVRSVDVARARRRIFGEQVREIVKQSPPSRAGCAEQAIRLAHLSARTWLDPRPRRCRCAGTNHQHTRTKMCAYVAPHFTRCVINSSALPALLEIAIKPVTLPQNTKLRAPKSPDQHRKTVVEKPVAYVHPFPGRFST